ncbi:hypothetical protein [Desulfuribacillus alkaliarsenatis]|uniref:Uncharacterized protein n=1 Tax=Desulfuribacillus alkaliarsenatis TaxID=766136 RepID=A0A1E5G2M6_9FIRM|nr:hypothetical protein [Desulfuribacillus alkaliarsenatis]OEF97226.1 hypothetical protein BHF68_14785 [Desulfuribacillus alkaliarsenatis]
MNKEKTVQYEQYEEYCNAVRNNARDGVEVNCNPMEVKIDMGKYKWNNGEPMDYKKVLEEQIKELQRVQRYNIDENHYHVPHVCELSKQILDIVRELRVNNY